MRPPADLRNGGLPPDSEAEDQKTPRRIYRQKKTVPRKTRKK